MVYTASEDIFLLGITSHTPALDKETILGMHVYQNSPPERTVMAQVDS
jgi:hypothetical protein